MSWPKGADALIEAGGYFSMKDYSRIARYDTDPPEWEEGISRSERCEDCRDVIYYSHFVIAFTRPDYTFGLRHDRSEMDGWEACKPRDNDVRGKPPINRQPDVAWYRKMQEIRRGSPLDDIGTGDYLDGSGTSPGRWIK